MTDSQLLMVTGKNFAFTDSKGKHVGVLSLKTGSWHAVFQKMAQRHAKYQADHQTQGHQLWEEREKELRAQIKDCNTFSEIANESWPNQDREAAAEEMYISWKKSPGHWSACNGVCKYWGYSMVLGKNNIWYAAGVFGSNE